MKETIKFSEAIPELRFSQRHPIASRCIHKFLDFLEIFTDMFIYSGLVIAGIGVGIVATIDNPEFFVKERLNFLYLLLFFYAFIFAVVVGIFGCVIKAIHIKLRNRALNK